MIIEFDPEKDEANRLKHGISLAVAQQIDFDRATIIEDRRFDYGEPRYIAFGRLAIGFTACGLPGEARTFG